MQSACICYAGLGPRMHPRNFVFITLLVLCHLQLAGQVLTNALPPVQEPAAAPNPVSQAASTQLPEDPSQELLPVANPEPAPATGVLELKRLLGRVREGRSDP